MSITEVLVELVARVSLAMITSVPVITFTRAHAIFERWPPVVRAELLSRLTMTRILLASYIRVACVLPTRVRVTSTPTLIVVWAGIEVSSVVTHNFA